MSVIQTETCKVKLVSLLPYYQACLMDINCVFILYHFTCVYLIRLHNNGRMLDIYWRLNGMEDMFFQTYDLEISNMELKYIIQNAEQWRGEEGERRKVAVYDYIWEEQLVSTDNSRENSSIGSFS